ncbi:chromosome segregation protein SMC [Metabacillus rhizolycopersici]|uniref:Chromosome partition protein Smc n=1 Tax=Metabacillus rhizolycopersici TaxID=2875709 RepID=A0ABS7UNH2_9BACI|nr:chromosome segregation protein SMC [Metabacillus rhizolycopersici]MBZ5749842.1 chromosome segregation protein SMC [Metabacillus rhizolycopersici]
MFLKRLDIVGFKSFAERVSVDFVQGVTAVVGPNGSGKSNITDAIRWVLGEQSAKSLRGAKMEDIIFVGSDSRKALNIAEVTLTLDNDDHFLPIDYREVSITRRVYRSGESEFFINKQGCRLKDIVDLFMDSGLGKEAFSIISQGKVEEILSSKSEERRMIFEEAAGVLKYKTRKKKAEYKLAETQENLNRVQDILHELENQVEPLKIQASIAKDYLQKKDELEQIEVALTVHEIEDLYQKYEALTKSFEEGKDRELKLSATIQKRESEIVKMRDHLAALDDSIHDLQQVLLLASEELEKLEGRKEVLKERKKNAHQNKAMLEKTITELTDRLSHLNKEKQNQESYLVTFTKEVQSIKEQLAEKQALISSFNQNVEETIEGLKSEYFELLNEQASARNEIQYLDEQLSQQERKNIKLLDSNQRYITERQEILVKKTKIEAKYSLIESKLSEQIKSFRDAQTMLESGKNAYQKKESALYQVYQILQQTRSRKDVLESMQEDYAGFFQGVKEILKAKDQLGGIHGAVAELISTDKQYETAIEIALSSSLQYVVVEDEATGRKAIQFLKKNSFGRATFFPLSVIKERSIAQHDLRLIQTHQAFVGVATDLVKYQDKFKKVIANLLGTVIVTSDLKGANEIAKLMNYRYRLVTLQGDVVNPGGSMTGGAVKQKNNSLLSRGRELEAINEKLLVMEEKTAHLEKDVKETKETIEKQEELLEKLRSLGEQLRIEEQMIRSEKREIELNEKNVNDHLMLYDAERESYDSDKERYTTRKMTLTQNVQTISTKLKQLDDELEELSAKKVSQQTSKAELQDELTDLKVVFASKQQIYENQKEKVERIKLDLQQSLQKYEEAKEDYSLLSNEMNTSSSGEEKLEEAASKKLQDKNKTIELIATRREERLQLFEKLEFEERELKEFKRQEKQFHDSLKDEEVKLNRFDVELDNLLNHLREEYSLTFEGAKEKYSLEMDIDEARKRVKLIKLSIDELGTVNLGAIDEYERISERFTFLSEQQSDLLEAKDTLYLVIDEMDEEMKKRFEQTFNAIRSHFEIVFQALFGGGRAELKLVDPKDLLNTGVDIIAQPPGKKLQNLSLLSGGERALTAIALLFSILKVRPVPFCVLDEVEAALDEANVFRFAQYLKKFSHETQFIVITHRKGTMEEADVLYGVTMQESGVSKLVSVRLEDSNELVQSS